MSKQNRYLIRAYSEIFAKIPDFNTVKDEITFEDYKTVYDISYKMENARTYIVTASTEDDAIKFAFALDGGYGDYRNNTKYTVIIVEYEPGTLALAKMYCEVIAIEHRR